MADGAAYTYTLDDLNKTEGLSITKHVKQTGAQKKSYINAMNKEINHFRLCFGALPNFLGCQHACKEAYRSCDDGSLCSSPQML
jgi:hypothetical protein